MNESLDKRKHKRLRVHVPVKYRALKTGPSGMAEIATLSKDLSEGGVRFRAAEFISIATRLILEMNLPLLNKPVKAISKIAWIRKAPAGDSYEIGGRFLEMSDKDKEIIAEYVDSTGSGDDSGENSPQ